MDKTTHFGFETIAENEKAAKVASVFHSVAPKYDVMNDLMSFGWHRAWKRFALFSSGVRSADKVLDIAGGTGDLAHGWVNRVGEKGEVWLTDINHSMLTQGRDRLLDKGVLLPVVLADAEQLPFPDHYFNCVSVAFGLRNMTHKEVALSEMRRVLRPGGRLLVLEFSSIWKPLAPLYQFYSFKVLPLMGKLVAGDADSYRYLAESICVHPDQETLKRMMLDAGFNKVDYHNLTGGVVALHTGFVF